MPICWECGKEATEFPNVLFVDDTYYLDRETAGEVHSSRYIETKTQRGYCADCLNAYRERRAKEKAEYVRLKKELMFERAIRVLEKQNIDIYQFREAAFAVLGFARENPNKFSSAYEMIAAMVLINNRIKVKTQFKVAEYRVDFLLPELKVALEIDGGMHEYKLYKDNERDIKIRSVLGNEWEIVRIKAEYIEENAKRLVDAIKAIRNEKKKIRSENFGLLPEWYSKREAAQKHKKQQYGDELLLG